MSVGSEHTHVYDFHISKLHSLCRLCCARAQTRDEIRKKRIFKTKTYSIDINMYCSIDINTDIDSKRPDKICATCYNNKAML